MCLFNSCLGEEAPHQKLLQNTGTGFNMRDHETKAKPREGFLNVHILRGLFGTPHGAFKILYSRAGDNFHGYQHHL